MTPVRENFKTGTLSAGASGLDSILHSAAFASLAVIDAPFYERVVLDPLGKDGEPEIVHVVGHADGSTAPVVARGQEGTERRGHVAGTLWKSGPVAADFGAVYVDASTFGIYSWESSLGAGTVNGSPLLTNTVRPFHQGDVGKVVIVGRISGAVSWFMSTIVSVDSAGVATMADDANITITNTRMTWGFDQTDRINDALIELSQYSTAGGPRLLRFPQGIFRATQIVIAVRSGIVGEGWGDPDGIKNGSSLFRSSTIFKQLPGANVDHMRFEMQFALGSDTGYTMFDRLEDFILEGPETNIDGVSYTAGGGMVFKNPDGTHDLLVQDGCIINRVESNYHLEDGFSGLLSPVPNAYRDLRAYYNGQYGFDFDGGNGGNPQACDIDHFSGDGNSEGCVRIKNLPIWAAIKVTTLKSEMGSVVENPNPSTNYQPYALVLEHCKGSVVVDVISHTSALHDPPGDTGTVFQAPRAGIKIIASSPTDIPQLRWGGVAVRDHSVASPGTTETGGPGPTVEDTFNGFTSFARFGEYGVAAADPLAPSIGSLIASQGSPVAGLVGGGRRQCMLFDGTADESAAGKVFIPAGWNSITVSIEWCNAAGGSGDVLWLFLCDQFAEGDTTDVAEALFVSGNETAGAQDVFKSTPLSGSLAVDAGQDLFFRIKRVTSNGSDTLANDAALLGILITRAT